MMQLATLIDLHYTVGTFSRRNIENLEIQAATEPHVEVPPSYKKNTTLDLSVQEPEVARSSVTTFVDVRWSPPELRLSLQSKEPITEITTDGVRDSLNDHYLPEHLSSLTLDKDHGVLQKGLSVLSTLTYFFQFRRYHQSDIILRGRSCLKEGWWAGGMEVQVQGQPALIKRYDDPKVKAPRVRFFFLR